MKRAVKVRLTLGSTWNMRMGVSVKQQGLGLRKGKSEVKISFKESTSNYQVKKKVV